MLDALFYATADFAKIRKLCNIASVSGALRGGAFGSFERSEPPRPREMFRNSERLPSLATVYFLKCITSNFQELGGSLISLINM